MADYSTKKDNILSFSRGDFIQLISDPDTQCPTSGKWIFGKLENCFGWVPADYVQPVVENQVKK